MYGGGPWWCVSWEGTQGDVLGRALVVRVVGGRSQGGVRGRALVVRVMGRHLG